MGVRTQDCALFRRPPAVWGQGVGGGQGGGDVGGSAECGEAVPVPEEREGGADELVRGSAGHHHTHRPGGWEDAVEQQWHHTGSGWVQEVSGTDDCAFLPAHGTAYVHLVLGDKGEVSIF